MILPRRSITREFAAGAEAKVKVDPKVDLDMYPSITTTTSSDGNKNT